MLIKPLLPISNWWNRMKTALSGLSGNTGIIQIRWIKNGGKTVRTLREHFIFATARQTLSRILSKFILFLNDNLYLSRKYELKTEIYTI